MHVEEHRKTDTVHTTGGTRVFVCMRNRVMGCSLHERIRPMVFGSYACWCDKPETST